MWAVAKRFEKSKTALPGDSSTLGDVEEAIRGWQLISRTATSTFVQEKALPELYKMTSGRPRMIVSAQMVRNRLHADILQNVWLFPGNTKIGKFTTGLAQSLDTPWRMFCCLQHSPAWPVWVSVGWHFFGELYSRRKPDCNLVQRWDPQTPEETICRQLAPSPKAKWWQICWGWSVFAVHIRRRH